MSKRPQDTSAEEPDGGNPHIRFRGGPRLGDRPGLLNNSIPELTPHLKQLRLSGILDSLEARNRQAIDSKLAYTEFLALLIQDEIARRDQKKFTMRLRRAGFRATKTIEQFDFERLPKLNRVLVHDLATGRYLSECASFSSRKT